MKVPSLRTAVGVVAALALILGLTAVFLLPRIIDAEMIKRRISTELTDRFAINVSIGNAELLWFPKPSVVLNKVEISFDGSNPVSIQTVKIYPSLINLLMARLVMRSVLLLGPRSTILLPTDLNTRFDLEALEQKISAALVRFTADVPVQRMSLSNGWLEVRRADKSPVVFQNLEARAAVSAGQLNIALSARSNISEALKIDLKVLPANFASELSIGVRRLQLSEALALIPASFVVPVREGNATFDVKISATGLHKFQMAVRGSTGDIVLTRHRNVATVKAERLQGSMNYEEGGFEIAVKQLDLASPRLQVSGRVGNHAGSVVASLKARNGDIAELSSLASSMFGDAEEVKRILKYIHAGKINEIAIENTGRTLADLVSGKSLTVSALLRGCNISVPATELQLTDVGGAIRLTDGVLEAKELTASLGTAKASSGTLKLGLATKPLPFHLDAWVDTEAAELQRILLKVLRDETSREELLKIQSVEGELSGRLILGESVENLSPIVKISKADIRARYEPVPFPIAIRQGQLNYQGKILSLEDAAGSLGDSNFSGLAITLHQDGSQQFKLHSNRALVDLQQAQALLRAFDATRTSIEKVRSMRGQIEFQNLDLGGSYNDPEGWTYASTGTFRQAEFSHEDLPDRMVVSRGRFEATSKGIKVFDAVAAIADASLTGSGTLESAKGASSRVEFKGTVIFTGDQMTTWLGRRMEFTEIPKFRFPIKITAERFARGAGGDISFRGTASLAGDSLLSIDAEKHPGGLVVRNLVLRADGRRAQMTLNRADDNIEVSFSGDVTSQSIATFMPSFPVQGVMLTGDIQIKASLTTPANFSARGHLSGQNLPIPVGGERAWAEKFKLDAKENHIHIQSADLRWRNTRLAVSGEIQHASASWQLDLDIDGDRLALEDINPLFTEKNTPQIQSTRAEPSRWPLEGAVRVKLNNFTAEGFAFSSLQVKTTLSPASVRTDIDRGTFCGIDTSGKVEVLDKIINLDLRFSAKAAPLEPMMNCLTDQHENIKGTYSLSARVAGRGDREQLPSSLQGRFEFSARDGEFVRSPGIDATFDYLNQSGQFAVNFPDLNKDTFPYQVLSAKGSIDGKRIVNDEVVIQAAPFTLGGSGVIDLLRRQLDLKGLVSIALPTSQVIKRVPLVGNIIGGSLVGVPIRVSGPLEKPEVVYLSPADVGGELLNLPMRILGVPLESIKVFVPHGAGDADKHDQ